MSTRHLTFVAASVLLALMAACSSTEPAGMQIDDATITTKVKAKLVADPEVNPFEIDVDTQQGVVRLSGVVDEPGQVSEAAKLARQTAGVRGVVNDIEVGSKSLGESIDDSVIVTRVKARIIADVDMNPFDIDVDAQKGVVTLSGRVGTEAQKDEAGRLAAATPGVRRVVNLLEVGEAAPATGQPKE